MKKLDRVIQKYPVVLRTLSVDELLEKFDSRCESRDPAHIKKLSNALKSGVALPPPIVYEFVPENPQEAPQLWLVTSRHTRGAYQENKIATIECEVLCGKLSMGELRALAALENETGQLSAKQTDLVYTVDHLYDDGMTRRQIIEMLSIKVDKENLEDALADANSTRTERATRYALALLKQGNVTVDEAVARAHIAGVVLATLKRRVADRLGIKKRAKKEASLRKTEFKKYTHKYRKDNRWYAHQLVTLRKRFDDAEPIADLMACFDEMQRLQQKSGDDLRKMKDHFMHDTINGRTPVKRRKV